MGAIYRTRVMNVLKRDRRGEIIESEPATDWSAPVKNLILPGGFGSLYSFKSHLQVCHAGNGTTPNKVVLDGTFSQTGTTVTRSTGAGVFASGNVNDFIKFASGERAKITAYVNTLTVTVDRAQTVAAAALTVYDCSRLYLDAWLKAGGTYVDSATVQDTDARSTKFTRTFDFAAETTARIYTEIGVSRTGSTSTSALFSRVLLDAPVSVDIEQFLQVKVELMLYASNYGTSEPFTVNVTGWPRPYTVTSITPGAAGGTAFDVLLTEAVSSHYVVGRTFEIAGALPVKTNITSLASTGSDFTVTATAHGKTVGQSIVIEGATPGGYNGTWTIATVPNANSFTVTSGINPGAGSGGTVRLATPATWFDGTWTIASFPTASTIRVTNNTVTVPAGAGATVKNSLAATAIITGFPFTDSGSLGGTYGGVLDTGYSRSGSEYRCFYALEESLLQTGLTYGTNRTLFSGTGLKERVTCNLSLPSDGYDPVTRRRQWTATIASAQWVSQSIRQIVLEGFNATFWITFAERQRKDAGFQLVLNLYTSWEPVLD